MDKAKLKQEISDTTSARVEIENSISSTLEQLEILQQNFETNIQLLKSTQEKENNLKEQLYELQKQSIKESMNLGGIKKAFSDSVPFFGSLKEKTFNKAKEIKSILDGSYFENQWVDEHYEKYKLQCEKNGDTIKNKNDFEQIVLALKKLEKEENSINVSTIFSKVSKELGYAKNVVKNVFNSVYNDKEDNSKVFLLGYEPSPTYENIVVKDKKDAFEQWVRCHVSINMTNNTTSLPELYSAYCEFIRDINKDNQKDILYKNEATFLKAINNYFPNLHTELELVEGKEIKRLALSSR